jgi:hypothetical protein
LLLVCSQFHTTLDKFVSASDLQRPNNAILNAVVNTADIVCCVANLHRSFQCSQYPEHIWSLRQIVASQLRQYRIVIGKLASRSSLVYERLFGSHHMLLVLSIRASWHYKREETEDSGKNRMWSTKPQTTNHGKRASIA